MEKSIQELQIIQELPKTELHLHLDGSLPEEFCKRKAKELGFEIPTIDGSVRKWIRNRRRRTMKESLSIFDYFNQFLQTKQNLTEGTVALVEQLRTYNVVYAEIRFCPFLHTLQGLTEREVCKIVIDAFKSTKLPGGIIVCGLRQHEPKKVQETLDVALECGAIGFDIAGNEQDYHLTRHETTLKEAAAKGNLTLHAGERRGCVSSIKDAMDLGARRIGHGCEIVKDQELMKRALKERICIESCPIANIGSKMTLQEHPIKKMFDYGLDVCLSSDNLLLAGSTGPSNPNSNHARMLEIDFSLDDLEQMTLRSIDHAFCINIDKESLKKQISDGYSAAKLAHGTSSGADGATGTPTPQERKQCRLL